MSISYIVSCDVPECDVTYEYMNSPRGPMIPPGWLRDPPYTRRGMKSRHGVNGIPIKVKHYCPQCSKTRG